MYQTLTLRQAGSGARIVNLRNATLIVVVAALAWGPTGMPHTADLPGGISCVADALEMVSQCKYDLSATAK